MEAVTNPTGSRPLAREEVEQSCATTSPIHAPSESLRSRQSTSLRRILGCC